MATQIIGRDEELGSIEAFMAEVEQGPSALVLSGEAGIGKTTLWESGVEAARERRWRVLSHRSVQAEALLSFAGLSDLLAPVIEEVAPVLAPMRRRALEVALLLIEPGEEPPDPRAIGLALLDALRALAEEGPVVVALDDVQWLDGSSSAALQMALRRLGGERFGLLATLRKLPEVSAPFELGSSFPEERRERLWVGPLGLGALQHLLLERLGLELTRPELGRVLDTSTGNPFFALELGRELVRTNERPAAGRALRVPESLRDLLGGRVGRLPAETADVLLYAAALARPTVDLVAAARGDRADVLAALEPAVGEGVVGLDASRLIFAHPLLASVCYEQASLTRRQEVHRALAGAVTDVEERARHRALAAEGPDSAVAAELEAAAEQAAARGATAAAADLSELAAELTAAEPGLAQRRRLRAAHFHRLAGASERAVSILEQLLPEVPHGLGRADVLFALASTLRFSSAAIIELCGEAFAEAAGDDARSARILGYRGWIRLFQADVRGGLSDARAALERAERVGDPVLLAVAIGHVATAEGRAGESTPGLLDRGVEIEERLGLVLEFHESPRVSLSRRLVGLGELDRARAILDELEQQAADCGDEQLRGQIIGSKARVEWFAGRWLLSLDHVAAARELFNQTMAPHSRAVAGRLRSLAETDLGLVEQARASAREALATAEAMSDEEWRILTLGVLGRLELTLGDIGAALGYLRELPGQLLSLGYADPMAPLWADTIEALIAGGELGPARGYLDAYEDHARRLGSPWAVAAAARCRGLLSAAEGELAGAFSAFERSLSELEGLPYPLERGRTLLCLGSACRQARQKRLAREALEGALAVFVELGARLWAEKARAELKRISGRRRMSEEELTETEERVAGLAARGLSSKAIAAELFMSVHTVGAHLSRVYRKLGIRSRAELAGRLTMAREAANAANASTKSANDPAKV